MLLVPLVLAGVLGWLRVAATSQSASDLNALVDRVALGQQVSELTHQLQNERSEAAKFVASDRREFRPDLDDQMARVDQTVGVVTNASPDDFGPAASRLARTAQIRLQSLPALREAVLDTRYPTAQVNASYTQLIDALRALGRAVFTTPDLQLRAQADDVVLLGEVKEQVQRQHAALLPLLVNEGGTTADQLQARSTDAQLTAALAQFAASGQPSSRDLYAQVVSGPDVDNRERIETSALTAVTIGAPVVDSAIEWDDSAQVVADLARDVESRLQEQLRTDGADLATAASAGALRDGVIVAVAVVIALVLLLLVAQAIIRPLRSLRNAAFDVAQTRLPQAIERAQNAESQDVVAIEPIDVNTREEIGEVARAFDAVHAEAVRLASEQALLRANVNDIFVNLSRRSQGLVKRQLTLIDKLESDEQDPDHLGDLFQLDHLATRMRRNNENLLVLAGAAELRPRRRKPVPADDVLRAAVSEVEDYQRIVVRRAPNVSVAGPIVNDLVHLVAELLDNATSFSPPASTVVLSATIDNADSLVVEISDSGVGIDPPTLDMINRELANPPTVDVAVSRRMGLFVVGRLAQRNDVRVRLQPASSGQGLVAVVSVPSMFLLTAEQAAAAEMGTSEMPAPERSFNGADHGGRPQTGPQPRQQAPRQQDWSLGGPDRQVPPSLPRPSAPMVPAPRQGNDPRVNEWVDFEVPGARQAPGAPDGRTDQYRPGPPPRQEERRTDQYRPSPQQQAPQQQAPQQSAQQSAPHMPPVPQGPQAQPPMPRQPQSGTDPLTDLFEAVQSGPAETEREEPIYDEVRSSWFKMRVGGEDGGPDQPPAGQHGPTQNGPAQQGGPGNGRGPGRNGNGHGGNGQGDNGHGGNSQGGNGRTARPAPPTALPAAPSAPVPTGASQSGGNGSTDDAPPAPAPAFAPAPSRAASRTPARTPAPSFEPNRPAETPAGVQAAEEAPLDWGPVENGWLAARQFSELVKEHLTESGLPKRNPRSRLIPGSLGGGTPTNGDERPERPRDAEAVRGRLTEYQRGLRHGRYAQAAGEEPDMAEQHAGGQHGGGSQ
ncbi:sensor histidine kinase [Pseudonocardia lacus]|uniref:sensor histidine kinase n=1 Tax=Pseudonocardia lacus TaxID=2835865 RepID=UPI001BDCCBA2|nr:nitrate- and nitrite sensing domain-containing protein [Pseudonocardia lacus]